MITARGQVKVLDFGLAKITRRESEEPVSEIETQAKTEPGVLLGTTQYMSPEQVLGRDVDSRSDIFSLGAVLYEMATGHRPFSGVTTMETLNRIVNAEPEAITQSNNNLPIELETIIRKCLEKEPDRRYQSARELAVDLGNLKRDVESGTTTARTARVQKPPRARPVVLVGLMVAVALGVSLVAGLFLGPRERVDSVAVLPFINVAADPQMEYIADGLTESLINNLSRLPDLKVIAYSSVARYKGKETDIRAVARDLDVHVVVTGRIVQRGDGLSISVELADPRDNSHMWGQQFNTDLSTIAALQGEMSSRISEKLKLTLSGEAQQQWLKQYPESARAYQPYLRGRFHWNKRTEEGLKQAIEYFNQAIEEDPSFGLAYAGLADAYLLLGDAGYVAPMEAYPKAKQAAMKALKINNALAEAHTSFAFAKLYFDWDWAGAESGFKRAIELNPSYATAHHWYGNALITMGRATEGLRHLQQAKELDPLSPIIDLSVGWMYYRQREYDEAIEQFRKTIGLNSNFAAAHSWLGWAYLAKRMDRDAIAEFQQALALAGESPYRLMPLAHAYAVSGNQAEAMKLLNRVIEESNRKYVSPYRIAAIYAGLGDKDQAFQWLDKAYQERAYFPAYLEGDPVFDTLRSDPKFQHLLH